MYFVFSKLLIYLLIPILWVFVLLIFAITSKNSKRKRRLLIIAVVLLYVFANPFLLNQFAGRWDIAPYPANNHKVYSCVIVLGGFSSVDKNGNGYFNSSADRFIQGIRLLATGKAKHLLITGGNGNLIPGKFRESDWVKTQLKELKVPDSSILIEDRSRNTIENAVFSKTVLQNAHLQPPYLLVTSAFHMRRALMIFKKEGFNVDAYPCNFSGDDSFSFDGLIPDAGALGGWNIYFKEMIGYVVDRYKK